MNARTIALVTLAASTALMGCSGASEESEDVEITLDKDGNVVGEDGSKVQGCMAFHSLTTQGCWSW